MAAPKIGLALGSGAARGLAHFGVIKVLQKSGIKIDYVAGTSVGAVVGAYFALHENTDDFENKVSKLTKNDLLKLVDFTAPKKAIIAGDRIKKFLVEVYGDKSFSDTKIPLCVVAADLYTGDEVVIKDGKLADAVRASISIPGIFVPVEKDGRLLVDGGIINTTPIDIVKKMGADIIIGVDLPVIDMPKGKSPNIVEALLQSFEIMRGNLRKTKSDENTVLIVPKITESISGYKFYRKDYIDEGVKAAEKELTRIKKMISDF